MTNETPDATFDPMPYEEPLEIGEHRVMADELIEILGEFLTDERKAAIAEVLEHRTYRVATVLDGIYDRGNASAVFRTAEALGYQSMHVVESEEGFKEANRVTKGADQWLDVERYDTPEECIPVLQERGYRIVATDLEAAVPIAEVDFTEPTAMVFGNEKDGVSEAMLEAADVRCVVPMVGFVQSYNISVGAALALYHIYERRVAQQGPYGDLTDHQKRVLTALYYARSMSDRKRMLNGILNRWEAGELF